MEEMLEIIDELGGRNGFVPVFKDMDETDWDGFAGADEGSKIAYGTKFTFILSPTGRLTVIGEDDDQVEIGVVASMR